MGDAIRALVDSLYTRLVLRDFVGKVVPGAITLVALGTRLSPARDVIAEWNFPTAVVVAFVTGACWITGLALQSLGEAIGMISYWPAAFNDAAARYDLRLRFSQLATPEDKQQAERFSIILEASALSSVSLLVAAAVALSYAFWPTASEVARWRSLEAYVLIAVFVFAALVLWRLHRTHRAKLYVFLRQTCTIRGAITSNTDAPPVVSSPVQRA